MRDEFLTGLESDGWQKYTDETIGWSVHYPGDWNISNSEPGGGVFFIPPSGGGFLYIHAPGFAPFIHFEPRGLSGTQRADLGVKTECGTLQLSVSPRADIFLDSRRVGAQVTQLNLADVRAEVEHQIRIVAPGHKTLLRAIKVKAGKVEVLKFELTRVDTSASDK